MTIDVTAHERRLGRVGIWSLELRFGDHPSAATDGEPLEGVIGG